MVGYFYLVAGACLPQAQMVKLKYELGQMLSTWILYLKSEIIIYIFEPSIYDNRKAKLICWIDDIESFIIYICKLRHKMWLQGCMNIMSRLFLDMAIVNNAKGKVFITFLIFFKKPQIL